MKKNLYFVISSLLILNLLSCEVLDRQLVLDERDREALRPFNRAEERINGVYATLPDGLYYINPNPGNRVEGAMLASASDEAEHTLETHVIQQFNNGSWNEANNPDNAW